MGGGGFWIGQSEVVKIKSIQNQWPLLSFCLLTDNTASTSSSASSTVRSGRAEERERNKKVVNE